MWGEDGRWQDFIMQRKETTTWSGRARYSNKTAWMYYSNVFMIREVEVRCAHTYSCWYDEGEWLWGRAVMVICAAVRGCGAADRGHTCISDLLFPAVQLHSSKWAEGFCWSMLALTAMKAMLSEHTDICYGFVIHILIMGCNASNTA